MKRFAILALLALSSAAYAGGNHDQPPPNQPSGNPSSSAGAQSGSNAGAFAGAASLSDSRSQSGANSSSGGNKLATGPSTATVGDTTSISAGGHGGAGGSATGGTSRATGGSSRQQQQQGQAATLTGGNNAATTGSSSSRTQVAGGAQSNTNGENVGNGQSTRIGGTSSSYSENTLFIPPVVPPTPPSIVGIGQVITTTLACGPLQRVEKTPIIATNFGIFHDGHQQQGFTYDLASVVDVAGQPIEYRYEEQPNGDLRIIGSQATMFASVVAVSSAQNIALGGGSGASWGQGGGGSSGSMSQLVTNIQVRDCEVGFLRRTEPFIPVAPQQTIVRPVHKIHPARKINCK